MEQYLLLDKFNIIYIPESVIQKDRYIDLTESWTITNSGLDSYHSIKKIDR